MNETGNLLFHSFVYLLVALLAVPGAKRLGMGAVLGFLLAGVFIGPWGLALIRDAESIDLLERLSTIVLLFLVAMEATPERVRQWVEDLFSISFWQFVLTTLLIVIAASLMGLPWREALVSGLALSLSSGFIGQQAFSERYPTGSPLTDTGNRLLLTHGLVMLPLLALLPLLGLDASLSPSMAWGQVAGAAVVFVVYAAVGPLLLRGAFRYIVSVDLDEVFTAFALVLVFGSLLLMQVLDLPLEIGALLAGLLLVRSEYGSAIGIALRPFRGLLIGLFFLSVGLQLDFSTLIRKPLELIAIVILLVVIKTWILRTLLRYSSVPRRQRTWLATVLSQSGELAFVIIAFAAHLRAIPDALSSELMVIVALSMLTTPVLLYLAARRDTIPARQQSNTGLHTGGRAESQVIVAGFGRVGRVIARLLAANDFRTVIIDLHPDRFAEARAEGFIGFYGDALRPDLLQAAGADRAAVIVIAIDDTDRAVELVRRVRLDYPHLMIVCRAVDDDQHQRLVALGADRAYPETFESAMLMGEDVLELVGLSPLDARARAETFRDAWDGGESDMQAGWSGTGSRK